MQWQEVRTIYPDQYVLLEILDSHTEDNIQFVDEVALVRAIQDPDEATRELLKCKNNNIVYHTGQEKIAIELRINGIKFENGDKLLRSFGIGGDEYSFQKRIDQIQIGGFITNDIPIDFGVFHDDINYINGLIGLDILKSGNMVIDLHRMEMYPATST